MTTSLAFSHATAAQLPFHLPWKPWYTPEEAATVMDVTGAQVRLMCGRGEIGALKLLLKADGDKHRQEWRIPYASMLTLLLARTEANYAAEDVLAWVLAAARQLSPQQRTRLRQMLA